MIITSYAVAESCATAVGVTHSNLRAVRGIRTSTYFENANAPSTSTPPVTNTGTVIPGTTSSYTISAGTSAYLWSPQFSTATTLPNGKMTLDLFASISPTLDGSASNGFNSASGSVTLTTTKNNDIIYVSVAVASTTRIPSISGGSLTWNSRGSKIDGTGAVYTYWAYSSGVLSAASITANLGAGGNVRFVLTAFGINGANTAAPFDSGVSSVVSASGTGTSASVTINPSGANDFIIGAAFINANPTITVGAGLTLIANTASGNVLHGVTGYHNWAASGSQSVSCSWTGNQAWSIIGDAIISATSTTVSVSASAVSVPMLDGSVSLGFSSPTTSGSVTLSTTSPQDIVYVVAAVKGASTITVSTPSATGLSFTARGAIANGNNGKVWSWYAVSSSVFSGSVSVTLSSNPSGFTLTAFGVKGANPSSPFGIASPVTAIANTATPTVTINPSAANTFVVGSAFVNNNPTITVGSGFTSIANTAVGTGMHGASEFQSGAPAGSQTVSYTLSGAQQWAMLGDVIAPPNPTVFFSNKPSTSLAAGNGQVATTFDVTAGTIPALGYIQIVITSPATTDITVYWGNGKPTNIQVCFTYS